MAFTYSNKLVEKRVLLFGSTSGIGYALAEACLELGANVFITGSSSEKLETALEGLKARFPLSKVQGFTCDLSDGVNLEAKLSALLLKCTNDKKDSIHHVAYTAGDQLGDMNLDNVTIEAIENYSHVRRSAPIILAKLLKSGGFTSRETPAEASLTFTAGTLIRKPMPNWSVKGSLFLNIEVLRRALALDMAPYVRVNVVSPGTIETETFRKTFNNEKMLEYCKANTLTKTLPGPEEAVEAYLFAMKCRFITGEEILCDGGRTLV